MMLNPCGCCVSGVCNTRVTLVGETCGGRVGVTISLHDFSTMAFIASGVTGAGAFVLIPTPVPYSGQLMYAVTSRAPTRRRSVRGCNVQSISDCGGEVWS